MRLTAFRRPKDGLLQSVVSPVALWLDIQALMEWQKIRLNSLVMENCITFVFVSFGRILLAGDVQATCKKR